MFLSASAVVYGKVVSGAYRDDVKGFKTFTGKLWENLGLSSCELQLRFRIFFRRFRLRSLLNDPLSLHFDIHA